ncbi:MAG: carbon-nitrogen hydrolase family protein [Alphaproteobacteria bacterium]
MSRRFKAACIQPSSGREIGPNVDWTADRVRAVRDRGADFVFMPENVSMMEFGRKRILGKAAPEDAHPALAAFRELARETGAWLSVGSLTVSVAPDKVANRGYVIDSDGGIVARYDKIHMFDVDLDGGESYRESAIYRPGDAAVVADTPWARVGLSICYDLRFPYLYRALAQAGAELLVVPAAFTRQTGRAHWHLLLRARAVETGCFVIAAAQCGTHATGRETFGHSLIVAPWGEVLADGGEEPGVIVADIDLDRVVEARAKIPALSHDRAVAVETPEGSTPKQSTPDQASG